MATYTYKCSFCDKEKEIIHRMDEEPEVLCSACGSKMKRVISGGLATIFKGSGWAYKDLKKLT